MNDAIILLCGVILLLAILPMVLMGRAFKGAGDRKGPDEAKPGREAADSGLLNHSDGGDGGGDGE